MADANIDLSMDEAEAAEELTATLPPFPDTYYQNDRAVPRAGNITLLMFQPPTAFWATRCSRSGCQTLESLVGTYKRYKTTLRFYDASNRQIGTWSYTLRGHTISLREFNTSDRYAVDPMSEALCDDGGGGWTDDDMGVWGYNCLCPDGKDWSSNGCVCRTGHCGPTCATTQLSCGGSCVDPLTNPMHCGQCNNACSKTQGCQSGVCGACPTGQRACSSTCVNVQSDSANCGGCGVACSGAQHCVQGTCR